MVDLVMVELIKMGTFLSCCWVDGEDARVDWDRMKDAISVANGCCHVGEIVGGHGED